MMVPRYFVCLVMKFRSSNFASFIVLFIHAIIHSLFRRRDRLNKNLARFFMSLVIFVFYIVNNRTCFIDPTLFYIAIYIYIFLLLRLAIIWGTFFTSFNCIFGILSKPCMLYMEPENAMI